jgi:hypothetical protein
MSDVSSVDLTGELVKKQDVLDAIATVEKHFMQLMSLPPAFSVQVPNILRCLQELRSLKP